jgi:hypothetical protein
MVHDCWCTHAQELRDRLGVAVGRNIYTEVTTAKAMLEEYEALYAGMLKV